MHWNIREILALWVARTSQTLRLIQSQQFSCGRRLSWSSGRWFLLLSKGVDMVVMGNLHNPIATNIFPSLENSSGDTRRYTDEGFPLWWKSWGVEFHGRLSLGHHLCRKYSSGQQNHSFRKVLGMCSRYTWSYWGYQIIIKINWCILSIQCLSMTMT